MIISITKHNIKIQIDCEDLEKVNKYNWTKMERKNRDNKIYFGKMISKKPSKWLYLHHLILNDFDNIKLVDHIDGNSLNNKKNNLRFATIKENSRNRKIQSNNKTGYKGVSLSKNKKKYIAAISIDRKNKHLGRFNSKEEAALAYNNAAIKYYGEFARLNKLVEAPFFCIK